MHLACGFFSVPTITDVSSNVQAMIFCSFTQMNFSSTDYVRDTNHYAQVPNRVVYDKFFTEQDTEGKVVPIGSILQIARDVANWRMTSVDFNEVATGWYVLKFLKGEDGRKWIFVNMRSEMGYKIGIFEQMTICTAKASTFHLRDRVRNALKKEWDRRLKEIRIWDGTERVIVDVSTELSTLMDEELEEYEKQEGVEASAKQIEKHRERVRDAFRREVRDNDDLEMVSWAWNPEIKDCKVIVPLTSLVIHACVVATNQNKCHTPENMEHLVRTIAGFARFRLHLEMSQWSRILKRTLPVGQKRSYMEVNIEEHGMRANTAKLRMLPELCAPAGEAPGLQTLRDLIASSPNVHTTRDAFVVVARQFELSCQAFGVTQLILPDTVSHLSPK
jgi:hypothetical protein